MTKKPLDPRLPLPPGDLIDVLDRVFKKGIVIDTWEALPVEDQSTRGLRVSIAGVDVLRTDSEVSWRVLPDTRKKK